MTWQELRKEFEKRYAEDAKIRALVKKMGSGAVTFDEANQFAIQCGIVLAKTYDATGALKGDLTMAAADALLDPALRNNYELTSEAAMLAVETANKKAGIALKAAKPSLREDRIDGLAKEISEKGYENVQAAFEDQVINFTQSAVDDTVKVNASLQHKAGFSPKIRRVSEAGACEWCQGLAGTYDYPYGVPREIYRRHSNCRCTVEYMPDKTRRQDVWSKTWQQGEDKEAAITKKSTLGVGAGGAGNNTIRRELGSIDVKKTEEALEYFGNEIRNMPVEHAIVIDKNGNVVQFIGDEQNVGIFDIDLDGASIIHNHPEINGIVSFGKNDLEFADAYRSIRALKCVNKEYDYSMVQLKPMDKISYSSVYREAMERAYDTGFIEPQDEAMKILDERGYVKYDRTRV